MQAPFEMTEGKKRVADIISQFPATSSHWNEVKIDSTLLIVCSRSAWGGNTLI